MRSEKPKVTVLMPVYNGEKYLREAIDSILSQTFTDFEFLIVNDGSTDGSVNIINSYDDPRICLVHNEKNLKLPAALNKGIDLARGAYIARMDCDDLSLPARLVRQVAFMDAHPEYGLCASNMIIVNTEKEIIGPGFVDTAVPSEWTLLWENPFGHPTVMLRKEVLDKYNLRYRELFSEDSDLWSRLVLTARITRLPEVLLHYRSHSDSAFSQNARGHILQAIESSKQLACAIAGQEVPEFHRELTIYPQAMGEPPKHYDISAVKEWIDLLLYNCRKIFGWDELSYQHAKNDSPRLLGRILPKQ